jgi:hypothetical protein
LPEIYQIARKYTKLPENIPNCQEIYQIARKYTKLPENIPNCPKIHTYTKLPENKSNSHSVNQMVLKISKFFIQRPSKMYQNWGFGLKINHLATLLATPFSYLLEQQVCT